jgi:hypothetical protein
MSDEDKKQNEIGMDEFFKKLYEEHPSDEDILEFYDALKYEGFNRDEILKVFYERVKDVEVARELVIVCAMKGPQKAALTKLRSNGLTPSQMMISASGQIRTKNLSCARITASTADLAAYYLSKMPDLPKKIHNIECPAWLQFPSAACIKMPDKYRQMHYEFSVKFSERIDDGKHPFNQELYTQMVENSYLHPKINLPF